MRTPTEQAHDPIFRELNISAEIKRMWGPKWNAPELAYEFSNGRKFYLRTEDSGIYSTIAGSHILLEQGGFLLTDSGDKVPIQTLP
jgi:hypothetical protein